MIKLSVDLAHYSPSRQGKRTGRSLTLCLQIVGLWSGLFVEKKKKKRLKGFCLSQRKDGCMQWHNKWIMGADIGVRKTPPPPNRPLITTWCMGEGCHFFCSAVSAVTVSSGLSVIQDWQPVQPSSVCLAAVFTSVSCSVCHRGSVARVSVPGLNMTSHLSCRRPQTKAKRPAPHDSRDNADDFWRAVDVFFYFKRLMIAMLSEESRKDFVILPASLMGHFFFSYLPSCFFNGFQLFL